MSTLIAVHTGDGCIARCDAKCYNAQSPDYACICGGKNHGAGIEQAIENTRQLADQWIRQYVAENGLESYLVEIPARDMVQLELPLPID